MDFSTFFDITVTFRVFHFLISEFQANVQRNEPRVNIYLNALHTYC